MTLTIVDRVNTPIGAAQAVAALRRAWPQPLTRDEAALLLSLVAIETANGKSVQNFSPGNITASEHYNGKAWRPPWFPDQPEGASARNIQLHADMLAGKAPSAFRAFDTLDQGFADFARVLQADFPAVVAAAKVGDPDGFRVALSQGYSGDYKNPASTVTLQRYKAMFLPMFGDLPAGDAAPLSAPATAGNFIAALAPVAVVGGIFWWVTK